LRFQSNELGVEFLGEGFSWTKEDFASIAASLK